MAWPKGQPRPANSGRKAGTTNKRNQGIETFARSIVEAPAYQANLRTRAETGTLAPGMEAMLFHYAYGKPREQHVDDQVFMEDLLAVVLKHASTADVQKEIREVIEAHTGGYRLRAVA